MALTDEQLRAFVPRNYFLKEPYNAIVPEGEEKEEVTTSYGIPNTNAFTNSGGGGGGNYRTDYRPNYEYRKSLDYNPELSDLQNQKIMQNWKDYKGHDYYNPPEPTGVAKGINTVMNWMPYIGTMKKGAEFLGGMLPVNRRAIMENELRGAGVYTDDIGRIVAGPDGYNTAEGIMAGYNANQMTDKTFDKRTKTIANTLSNKYGVDISSLSEEEIANFDPNNPAFNLVNRHNLINQAKLNYFNTKKKADEIYGWEKQQKELARHKDGDRMSDKQYDDWRRDNDAGYNKTADEKLAMTGGTEEWGEDMMGGTEAPSSNSVADLNDVMARGGRVGYNRGRVVNPGGYSGNTYSDFLADKTVIPHPDDKSWRDVFYRWLDSRKAEGGRVNYFDGGIAGLL